MLSTQVCSSSASIGGTTRKLKFGPLSFRAWRGCFDRLRVHLAAIRKALGERQFGSRYISNIERGAYSFVGSVVCIE
jgi:hypothetical protein